MKNILYLCYHFCFLFSLVKAVSLTLIYTFFLSSFRGEAQLSLVIGEIGQDFVSKLFIGTRNGLVIYEEKGLPDDINWTHYTKENSGLLGNEIRTVAVDFDGNPWVGTDKGLAKWVVN